MSNKNLYVDPVQLAYYVCAKTCWTIGSGRLNYVLYIIAIYYAGVTEKMLFPNLFEVDHDGLIPFNPVVKNHIGYQKIIKHYHISLWPPSISVPSEDDYHIDREKREHIDFIIEKTRPLTNGKLLGAVINGRYRNGKFIDKGQISLKDMINQYNNIIDYAESLEK